MALGHATDDLVVGRIADASFPTPSAFGAWLHSVVQEKQARAGQAEEAKLLLQSQALLEQLRSLQASAARWRLAALAAAAALVSAVVWYLLRLP